MRNKKKVIFRVFIKIMIKIFPLYLQNKAIFRKMNITITEIIDDKKKEPGIANKQAKTINRRVIIRICNNYTKKNKTK